MTTIRHQILVSLTEQNSNPIEYEGVEADPPTNTIEDKPLDHVRTYADNRRDAYGSTGDQLDMQYHDAVDGTTTWKDHVAAVKAAHPKP